MFDGCPCQSHVASPAPLLRYGGSSGQHDNYGSALLAQPGRSQGRPATNASSRLIEFIGLPTGVLPVPLVPDGRTIRRDLPIPAGIAGTAILIPVTISVECRRDREQKSACGWPACET